MSTVSVLGFVAKANERIGLRGSRWWVIAAFWTLLVLGAIDAGRTAVEIGSGEIGASSSAPMAHGRAGQIIEAGPHSLRTVVSGLRHPWGMAFLPDGRALVTERYGAMRVLSSDRSVISRPLKGVAKPFAKGQGGVLDVAVAPDFDTSRRVFWAFAEEGAGGAGTAVARGELEDGQLTRVRVIFRQMPKVEGMGHFGARLAFDKEGMLFVGLGERQQDGQLHPEARNAEDLGSHLGKVVRIDQDGNAVARNPFSVNDGALKEIYSRGHRNIQGAAIHPGSGDLWIVEHGPQGGDELNRVKPGRSYGWPQRSYGCAYGSVGGQTCWVGGGTHGPAFEEPIYKWVPKSTAPSGMLFYSGQMFEEWRGNLFIGALAGKGLWRLKINGNQVEDAEKLLGELGERIRDVKQGPKGEIMIITDSEDGRMLEFVRRP